MRQHGYYEPHPKTPKRACGPTPLLCVTRGRRIIPSDALAAQGIKLFTLSFQEREEGASVGDTIYPIWIVDHDSL